MSENAGKFQKILSKNQILETQIKNPHKRGGSRTKMGNGFNLNALFHRGNIANCSRLWAFLMASRCLNKTKLSITEFRRRKRDD